jgi:peptidoglycan/xylan/chitin deacetylase (PgdA/CDA1 family)
MKLYQKFILIFVDICGVNNIFRFLNKNKIVILWYHGICDDAFRLLSGYDERHIQVSKFKKQIIFLKKKGYSFITMSELVNNFNNKKKVKKTVVLTFDDGYRNVVTNAYPIMKEFDGKGCFYLVTGLIESNKFLWTDYIETVIRNSPIGKFEFIFKEKKISYTLDLKKSYNWAIQDIKNKLRTLPDNERIKYLKQFTLKKAENFPKEFQLANWNEIQSLDNRILEIGSHSKNHPNLTHLSSLEEFEEEINNSKIEIEKKVNYKINHFCYPAGDYNANIIQKVKDSGYKSALSIIHGFNDETTDLYKLKRIEVPENFLEFKSLISGSFFVMKQIKAFFFYKTP